MLSKVISVDLFNEVLISPLVSDPTLNRLCVLSGYASAAMAFKHILAIKEHYSQTFNLNLIYGMSGVDGVSMPNHKGFLSLKDKKEIQYNGQFSCCYMPKSCAIHSKLYVWCRDEMPIVAFIGSANYTENGFSKRNNRIETLAMCDPNTALLQYQHAHQKALSCDMPFVLNHLSSHRYASVIPDVLNNEGIISIETNANSPFKGCQKVELSLLTNQGTTGIGSNLNWGHRRNGTRRNLNQAYIGIRGEVRETTFFPPHGEKFTMLTDDGEVFTCSRAQAGDKAIHTPHDNAEFGRYFRHRMKLADGALITLEDFKRYGRSSVTVYKLDDESYIMDFAVHPQ